MTVFTILYIDPGTGGAFFSSLTAIIAALSGGAAVFFSLLFRPVRRFFGRLIGLVFARKGSSNKEEGNKEEEAGSPQGEDAGSRAGGEVKRG